MMNFKIKTTAFSGKSDSEMDTFAAGVVAKVKALEEQYSDVKAFYDLLTTAQTNYSKAFADYIANNSDQARTAKIQAKDAVLAQLIVFGNALVAYCDGNEAYITNAGYSVHARRVISNKPNPVYAPPTVVEVRSKGVPGTIYVRLSIADISKVKMIYMEESDDLGVTWGKRREFTTLINTFDGFASKSDVTLRFQTAHAHGVRSPFSEIVTVTTN